MVDREKLTLPSRFRPKFLELPRVQAEPEREVYYCHPLYDNQIKQLKINAKLTSIKYCFGDNMMM